MVTRAERLAAIENPWDGLGDLDLMDFTIVVASSNNAAVENISLELPVRKKALDSSVWRDNGLDYFGHTATALLNLPADASDEERAWGLVAARLGRAENRRNFFRKFWWDKDWGLNDWLNRVAYPDSAHNRGVLPESSSNSIHRRAGPRRKRNGIGPGANFRPYVATATSKKRLVLF